MPVCSEKFHSKKGSENMREDVFSLSEGEVVLRWPTPLSAESIQDLKDWLKIVERKISRSEKSEQSEQQDQ
jgi:hypothetical protein